MSNAKHVIELYKQKKWLSLLVFFLVTAGLAIFSKEVGEWWSAYRKGEEAGWFGRASSQPTARKPARGRATSQPLWRGGGGEAGLKAVLGWLGEIRVKELLAYEPKTIFFAMHRPLERLGSLGSQQQITAWVIVAILGLALGFFGLFLERTVMSFVGMAMGLLGGVIGQRTFGLGLEGGLDLFVVLVAGLVGGAVGYSLPRFLSFVVGGLVGAAGVGSLLLPKAPTHDGLVILGLAIFGVGVCAALLMRWALIVVSAVFGGFVLLTGLVSPALVFGVLPRDFPFLPFEVAWLLLAFLCLSTQARFAKRLATAPIHGATGEVPRQG